MATPSSCMHKGRLRSIALFCLLLATTVSPGCAVGTRLDTRVARPDDIAGTYAVYLLGCRYPSDIETMALLVDAAGPYPVDLIAPPAAYRKTGPLAGPEALTTAETFVQCGIYATGARVLRGVFDPAGKAVAYEVKPLYPPLEMTVEEVLSSDYFLRDGRVRAFFELLPQVKRVRELDIPRSGDP